METSVVKTEGNAVAATGEYADLMSSPKVKSEDIMLPKILLTQSISQLVKDEKARAGEFRNSVEESLLAEKGTGVHIIPISTFKTWVTLKANGNFVRQAPVTQENANWEREEEIDGELCKNYETINYYCLLPSEVEEGIYMPYVVSFRSTSYMAGKTLESLRAKMEAFGKPIAMKTFILGSKKQEKDGNSWYAMTVSTDRNTTAEELQAVRRWNDIIKTQSVKVDDSDIINTNEKPSSGHVAEDDAY